MKNKCSRCGNAGGGLVPFRCRQCELDFCNECAKRGSSSSLNADFRPQPYGSVGTITVPFCPECGTHDIKYKFE